VSGTSRALLPANTTLLQPGARYFRLVDALQVLDSTNNVVALQSQLTALQTIVNTQQSQIATLQSQVATLEGEVAANTNAIATLDQRITAYGIP